MRIFLSHTRRDQPTVQAICSHLPAHIKSWIDERNLRIGEEIGLSIHIAITKESDFVVIFVGKDSVTSDWVKRELEWALERENEIRRTFVLPVLLDDEAWNLVEPKEFRKRKYLKVRDFDPRGLRNAAEELSDELFAWASRHMEEASADAPRVVVEILAIHSPPDYVEVLRSQGAPPEAIKQAREIMGNLPKHGLVVRIRNEGTQPVMITGFGVRASQDGKKRFTGHDYGPRQVEPIEFPPGTYHEFVVDLDDLARELKNPINQYSGIARLRGIYEGYAGEVYLSSAADFNLNTLELDFK